MKYTVILPSLPLDAAASPPSPRDAVFVVVAWEKGVGDIVRAGETLAWVRPGLTSREGPDFPVPSPAFGVLAKRAALPGEAIEVGEPLAVLAGVPVPVSEEDRNPPQSHTLPAYEPAGPEEAVARSPWDVAVAEHHARAWTESPHVFTVAVADVTEAIRLAGRVARGETVSGTPMEVGILPFVVRAAADALTRHSLLNTRFAPESAGEGVRQRRYIRIGVAIRDGAGRLCVPVLRDPERKSLLAVAREWTDLEIRAANGELVEEDVCGPTFTVAETSGESVLYQTPILHRPQAALLTFGKVTREPAVVMGEDGNEGIEVRARLHLCLAHDARLVEGATAAAFLSEVAAILADARFLFA